MLGRSEIIKLIVDENILSVDGGSTEDLVNQTQASSVDLTIKSIYVADNNISKSNVDICSAGLDLIELEPGQTIVIQVAEKFALPSRVAGIIFPPNSMSKSGVIMTNPGHIDPLFSGYISVYLVNMGKSSVRLKKGSKVATLLLYYINGDVGESRISGGGVSKEQVLTLSKDFANLETRMPALLNSVIRNKALIWGGLAVSIVALSFTLIPPLSERISSNKVMDAFKLEHVEPLKLTSSEQRKEIAALQKSLSNKSNQLEDLRLKIKEKDSQIQDLSSNIGKLFSLLERESASPVEQEKEDEKVEN
ncbi:dCTP deaminase domain-containing protein [Pseudoalteromonas sp. XMcav1-K]|uniref:dCTP deaminase domain-containing protein n=1 Tax=Pseudoalteromonas sp. XMcav1-K TaxID=3374372 RepID=UPI0037565A06